MNTIVAILDKYFIPIASVLATQRHLVAVRDGFIAVMPLILIGALAVLINNLPIPIFQEFMEGLFSAKWKGWGGNVWTASFAIFSILTAISISYTLAKSYKVDELSAALLTLGVLIIFSPATKTDWGIQFAWLGSQGLFVSIILALITTEIFRFFVQRNWVIRMPEGVPPGVARSFVALIPMTVTVSIFALAQLLFAQVSSLSLHEMIFHFIQQPLQHLANTLPSALLIVFLVHLLWFLGLHGPNILAPITSPLYLPAINENVDAFNKGVSAFDVTNIFTQPFFDMFVYMGGSGTTIALIAAIFIASKSAPQRSLAKMSLPAGLFNINEPIIFGLPIVLNPMLLIPFICIPLVLTVISYLSIVMGIVPKTVVLVPWTTPPLISGYLVTGGHIAGAILQIVNFVVATIMYMPFLRSSARIQ